MSLPFVARAATASLLLTFLAVPMVGCLPLDGRAERALKTSEPAPSALSIDSRFADVDVRVGGPELEVDARIVLRTDGGNATAEREIEHLKVTLERRGDHVFIRQGAEGDRWRYSGNSEGSGSIVVAVPAGVPFTVNTASGDVALRGAFGAVPAVVDTASGDIRASDLAVRDLTVNTASGDAAIELAAPLDAFSFHSASGDCALGGGAGTVDCSTASGDLSLRGLRGPVAITTASGDIRLSYAELSADASIKLVSTSGDVDIELPAGGELAGSVTTVSGSVTSETPTRSVDRAHVLTGKGPPTDITTTSGDVRIRRRK